MSDNATPTPYFEEEIPLTYPEGFVLKLKFDANTLERVGAFHTVLCHSRDLPETSSITDQNPNVLAFRTLYKKWTPAYALQMAKNANETLRTAALSDAYNCAMIQDMFEVDSKVLGNIRCKMPITLDDEWWLQKKKNELRIEVGLMPLGELSQEHPAEIRTAYIHKLRQLNPGLDTKIQEAMERAFSDYTVVSFQNALDGATAAADPDTGFSTLPLDGDLAGTPSIDNQPQQTGDADRPAV